MPRTTPRIGAELAHVWSGGGAVCANSWGTKKSPMDELAHHPVPIAGNWRAFGALMAQSNWRTP